MRYVDGYVLPVQKKHLAAYKSLARKAGKIAHDFTKTIRFTQRYSIVGHAARSIRTRRWSTRKGRNVCCRKDSKPCRLGSRNGSR